MRCHRAARRALPSDPMRILQLALAVLAAYAFFTTARAESSLRRDFPPGLQVPAQAQIKPGPIEEFIFYDHPSGYDRVHREMVWQKENLPAAPGGEAGR